MAYDVDQATLLKLRQIVQAIEPCVYLEVGSELGRSLQPALLDPKCVAVHSVDLRPASTPDERGRTWEYGVTAAQMIAELSKTVPLDQLVKLHTYDMDTAMFAARHNVHPNLVFLDAEHTNAAVFQDVLNLADLMPDDFIFAGHDSNLIFDALLNIKAIFTWSGVSVHLAYLPDVVFAFAFGKYIEPVKKLPHWDPVEYVRYARQTLNDEIIMNAPMRQRIENTGVLRSAE